MKKVDSLSQFGIPSHFFKSDKYDIKIILDPPNDYFTNQLYNDRSNYEKLILVHGCEPPLLNNIEESVIKNHQHFDVVYSFNQRVLNECGNSELFCFGSCWVLTDKLGNVTSLRGEYENKFSIDDKNFKMSFVKSTKQFLPGHKLRFDVSDLLNHDYGFETMYPDYIKPSNKMNLFKDSMFHLTIENSQFDNYFTEKIIDCFMSYTIPIYWGCPNINNYFNKDGIISFNTKEELRDILNNLTEEDYTKRIEAIKENYRIAYDNYAFFFDKINDKIKKL